MRPSVAALLIALGLGISAHAARGGMASVPPPEDVMPPEVIVTSDYTGLSAGAIKGRLGRESAKTGTRGRARMSIEVQAEPLLHVFDDVAQAQLLASAAAEHVKKKVLAINETVSDRTLETRKYQEAAHGRGEAWAVKRFGFRGNPRPPRHGESRMFNHSGTFADGIVGTPNKSEGTATLNVPAIRLDPRTSRHSGDFAHITTALIRLIPELGDPALLASTPAVKKALDDSVEQMVLNAAKRNRQLRGQLGAQLIDGALSALGMGGLRGRVVSIYG